MSRNGRYSINILAMGIIGQFRLEGTPRILPKHGQRVAATSLPHLQLMLLWAPLRQSLWQAAQNTSLQFQEEPLYLQIKPAKTREGVGRNLPNSGHECMLITSKGQDYLALVSSQKYTKFAVLHTGSSTLTLKHWSAHWFWWPIHLCLQWA